MVVDAGVGAASGLAACGLQPSASCCVCLPGLHLAKARQQRKAGNYTAFSAPALLTGTR